MVINPRDWERMAWSSVLWSSPGINAHNLNHFPLLPAASSPTHSPYSTKIKTLLACKHTHYCRSLLRDFGPCKAKNREGFNEELQVQEDGDPVRRIALQAALWSAEAAYILWLFLLPYAPVMLLLFILLFFLWLPFLSGFWGLFSCWFNGFGSALKIRFCGRFTSKQRREY